MLRKALPGDIDFIYELYMHPAVNPYLLYEPMDKRSFQPIYDELIQKGVKYVYEHENTRAGMVKLIPYTYRAAHVLMWADWPFILIFQAKVMDGN